MPKDRFDVMEQQTFILEEIASTFPTDSKEYKAIETASLALIFALNEQYESFANFIKSVGAELTDEQKENLRKMGISGD